MTTPRLTYSPELIRKAASMPAQTEDMPIKQTPRSSKKRKRYGVLRVVKSVASIRLLNGSKHR